METVIKVTKSKKIASKAGSRGDKCLAKFTSSNGSVFGSLTLDIRKAAEDYSQELPVAVRVSYDSQKVFLRLGVKYTMSDWVGLCDYEKSGRRVQQTERNDLKELLAGVELMTNQLIAEGNFSLRRLKDRFQGKRDDTCTIYSIWDKYLQTKREEGKVGSARCSGDVKSRFIKDMGESVALTDIDKNFVQRWVRTMKKGGLSATTIAIDLRTFRTIVNIAIERGLINGNTKEMFKDTGYNKVCSRKHEFLDVATMRKLYNFWEADKAVDADGKELFLPREKYAIFRDLGLFLFMYLGDGQNLADTLRLTYDGWYFATHGKQLRFLRHKTRDRNESASEVIFPVTPELQKIIDKYGNKPEQGKRVFPIMSEFITPEKEVWVIQRYNRYIREHMAKIAQLLGMEQCPTATWARHSFATNLNNSGSVPYKYISDSMGHCGNGDITSNYIGAYPLGKMLEYNWYLLNDKKQDGKEALLALLKNMTDEERKQLLASL
ncbi:site-specific integrase [Prevotella sp. A2931]|uniref:Site-specific integrase n=1 Tax=Prevotella illustrans TaxID=2800387 RepID=A0ABS3M7I2_9BACT|nr:MULTISPECIES: site-specific integrase [Prevotella]MBO1364138.1 site-specific integrase [Prevotella illustrans]PTL26941.1 recombinase [Prevotella sp. oral taxon 820]PTL32286.1 recombinase [Prevotella sp. oral taxon 376]